MSFDKSMLYYLVTLLAKHTSFFFEAMSKLFLKSCTIPTNNIEKICSKSIIKTIKKP